MKSSRPKEINLAGKRPCDLLSQQDWSQFFIEKQGESREDKDFGGPICFYSTNVGYFGVHLNPNEGVRFWTEASTSEKIGSTDPVKGFPALERAETRDKQRCDIIVDVADGQYLRAVASIAANQESKLPPRCELAHRLAEIAVTSLLNGS